MQEPLLLDPTHVHKIKYLNGSLNAIGHLKQKQKVKESLGKVFSKQKISIQEK